MTAPSSGRIVIRAPSAIPQPIASARAPEDTSRIRAEVASQNAVLDRIKDLEVRRTQLREQVAGFDQRITQLELENQTGALNLDVIEYARAGVRPVYPETEKTLIYGLGGSGILAPHAAVRCDRAWVRPGAHQPRPSLRRGQVRERRGGRDHS